MVLINKVYPSAADAIKDVEDGATILFGGFGEAGVAEGLIKALSRQSVKNITAVANNCGNDERGLARLFTRGQISKMIASFPRYRAGYIFKELFLAGEVELELVPQGTLAERIRAAGCGLGGFYTPTGAGTAVAEGKESRVIAGQSYVLEYPLRADFAFIKAHKADRWGNLIYRKAARNFNPIMATAATVTIAEVDEIVELGELDPESIVTPGVFVHRVVVKGVD